ncbi:hypothetical protein EDL98_04320 [Ornithobacterium rhinotracheale]|nr:hypothetical protein [Ornithobacterium rhinotracheale]
MINTTAATIRMIAFVSIGATGSGNPGVTDPLFPEDGLVVPGPVPSAKAKLDSINKLNKLIFFIVFCFFI